MLLQIAFYGFFCICVHIVCKKAGFPSLLGILALIPLLNILLLYYIAFAPWPRFPNGTNGTGIDPGIFE